MSRIAVVTDSNAGLPTDLARDLGIHVLPLPFQLEGKTFLDGEMAPEEMYRRMEAGQIPKTSQPSPGMFIELYQRLKAVASSSISIHVTGRHSGTCQTAVLTASMVPELDVTVVDSQGVSMGTGFLAIAAARFASMGEAKAEIVARLEAMRSHIHTYCTVATTRYLQASGRLGWLQGALASVLDIKPILTVTDGRLGLVGKARSGRRSLDQLLQLTQQAIKGARHVDIAVIHAGVREDAENLRAEIERLVGRKVAFLLEAPTILSAHGGPGLIGVVSCVDAGQ